MPPNIKPKPKSTLDKFLGMIDIFGIADKAKKQVEQRKRESISPEKKKYEAGALSDFDKERERAKAMHEARLKEGPYPSTPAIKLPLKLKPSNTMTARLNTRNKSEFPKRIIEKAKRFKEQRSSN